MRVREIMETHVITVTPETTLPHAIRLARKRGIRHLVVVEGSRLVGIVSDRDLKAAVASPFIRSRGGQLETLLGMPMAKIMTKTVITIEPESTVEQAARVMLREKISALPVVEHDRLLGIVTETNVLELVADSGRSKVKGGGLRHGSTGLS